MLRAIMLSMAVTLVALVASAHDPEGKWDDWFSSSETCVGRRVVTSRTPTY